MLSVASMAVFLVKEKLLLGRWRMRILWRLCLVAISLCVQIIGRLIIVGVLAFSFDGQYTEEGIRQKLIKLELLKEQQQSRNVCCCSSKLELGLLKEEEGRRKHSSSSTVALKLPDELPSVEEALKTLAAALKALDDTPGLNKADILRLRSIISRAKVYKELLADYIDYRGLEAELLELREKFAELAKTSKGASA